MTQQEAEDRLPPAFWWFYGAFGRLGQFIGIALGTTGLIGFSVSLFKKFL